VPDPGDPIAWNRFAYVYNNPVNYADPSGHVPVLLAAAYTVVDTAWDIVDVYSDIRDCFGDSDSMACAMLPIDALAVVALFAEGPSNNVARRTAKAADVGDAIPPSRALVPYDEAWAIRNTPRSDFYVRPNGDVIPATQYRYIRSDAEYLPSLRSEMSIPIQERPIYLSPIRFESGVEARHGLQIGWGSDARFRVRFDALQVADDLRVPYGKGGTAPWLEPLTKDYPEFGLGGCSQYVTNGPIYLDSYKLLPETSTAIVLYGGPYLPMSR